MQTPWPQQHQHPQHVASAAHAMAVQPTVAAAMPGQPMQAPMPQAAPRQAFDPAAAGDAVQAEAKGFFGALIDFSFTSFVATRLVKVIYAVVILGAVAFLALSVVGAITQLIDGRIVPAISALAAAPLGAAGIIVIGRLYLEILVVMFRVSESLSSIDRKTR